MSQAALLSSSSSTVSLTLTGNTGGAVGPDGSHDISVTGTGALTVTGNPGANTLVISGAPIGQKVIATRTTQVTTPNLIADDNSIPQIGEGEEYLTITMTPVSATTKLEIDVQFSLLATAVVTVGLFRDGAADAIYATAVSANNILQHLNFSYVADSVAAASTTFTVRFGADSDQSTAGGQQGGVNTSSISVTETHF